MKYKCDDCGLCFPREKCHPIKHASVRIEPGGIYTDKQCPSCGALTYPMPAVKIRHVKRGKHVHVHVFMGPDAGHRALCGVLKMYEPEFQMLEDSLWLGSAKEGHEFDFIVEADTTILKAEEV